MEIKINHMRQYLERKGAAAARSLWNVNYTVDDRPWVDVAVHAADELGVFKYLIRKHKQKEQS